MSKDIYNEAMEVATKQLEKEGKVYKTVPMTKEEKQLFQNGLDCAKKIAEMMEKGRHDQKKMWALINIRLNTFGQKDAMSINHETYEIEFRK